MTPLILASSAGREKVVNTLLTEGANVNAMTVDGHSALQYAASKNWKSICLALLEKDADVNIADKRGATPLHRSASKGNIAIVELLIEHGKKLNIGSGSVLLNYGFSLPLSFYNIVIYKISNIIYIYIYLYINIFGYNLEKYKVSSKYRRDDFTCIFASHAISFILFFFFFFRSKRRVW